tara:strand:- start:1973 stop:2185 length:213 start_codon:yes stop_codon:yes gene_type:complete
MAKYTLNRTASFDVDFATVTVGKSVFVTANGNKILEFTDKGHLVRLKNTAAVGLRRLPDGRIAIRPRSSR